jgi:hypothetical protein
MRWTKNNSRKRAEALVMKLESGKKIGEVLAEMGISLMQAKRMLRRPLGQKVLEEMRALRSVPRELAGGKKAEEGEAEEEEVPTELTEEERAALKESSEALAAAARERFAG